MKYRKKPVVIEAIQFIDDGARISEIYDFMGERGLRANYENPDKPILKIETLEGTMIADVNDWIIKGVKGEFYPCKPDVFEQTYEVA